MKIEPDALAEIENAARRIFAEDGERHRRYLTWALSTAGGLASVVLVVGGFFFGNSISSTLEYSREEIRSVTASANTRIDSVILAAEAKAESGANAQIRRILSEEGVLERINAHLNEELEKGLARIPDSVSAEIDRALGADEIQKAALKRVEEIESADTTDLIMASLLPIGTVVAWPGESPPRGWAICGGQAFKDEWDVDSLQRVLGPAYGTGRLPDYRGLFLRGANHDRQDGNGDPAMALRLSHDFLRTAGDPKMGSVQRFSTAMPTRQFRTDTKGSLSLLNIDDRWQTSVGSGTRPIEQAALDYGEWPGHSHRVQGGDPETRPVNVYVNWIIKVK